MRVQGVGARWEKRRRLEGRKGHLLFFLKIFTSFCHSSPLAAKAAYRHLSHALPSAITACCRSSLHTRCNCPRAGGLRPALCSCCPRSKALTGYTKLHFLYASVSHRLAYTSSNPSQDYCKGKISEKENQSMRISSVVVFSNSNPHNQLGLLKHSEHTRLIFHVLNNRGDI